METGHPGRHRRAVAPTERRPSTRLLVALGLGVAAVVALGTLAALAVLG